MEKKAIVSQTEVIDTVTDSFGIDVFLNHCLVAGDFHKDVIVKCYTKYPMNLSQRDLLEKINALLFQSGGNIYELSEESISDHFVPKQETMNLLRKYWGDGAEFRDLRIYKNPDYGKDIISVSQGQIVETIINEYENSKRGERVKDLFLTAPTGAGKSLLFQLPAFYVSEHSDVTIIVSPLIALMKDQVEQIRGDRGYKKVYFINSELSLIDRERVIEDCKRGEVDVLYLSPELLLSYDISYFLGERNLGLVVIDEAHLITTWGRDFRVDYWYLGQHLNKIRKKQGYKFPLVAVTATAIYGGDNDMVFDSVSSLYMMDPHIFIGEVTRKDITFVIDNHERFKSNYDSEKEKETVEFIKNISDVKIKTIVYAPYTIHIEKIVRTCNANGEIAVAYHGGDMSADAKAYAYDKFRKNEVGVMVATKAFGMGVDISDIQVVYHHSVSGLLPDYVQEIGRAARKKELNGFACISYNDQDLTYNRRLHGMSAQKHYQIREVLDKLNKLFILKGKKRNFLVSVEDFQFIYNNAKDFDQKVMTALMMIEKDYLVKCRFNVLIARPKKLFVTAYCRVNDLGLKLINEKYSSFFKYIRRHNQDFHILELQLDKIWEQDFSDISFPQFKRNFYKGKLFSIENNENLTALVKFKISITNDYQSVEKAFSNVLDAIQRMFNSIVGSYFSKEKLVELMKDEVNDEQTRNKIVNFILSSYTGIVDTYNNTIDGDAFLQKRINTRQKDEYRVLNNKYIHQFVELKKKLNTAFNNKDTKESLDYVSSKGVSLKNYIRIGSLLDILGLGTYECSGGDNPMIFIRINDPIRVARDAADNNYRNSLLTTTEKRFNTSSEIFDHFFLHSFDNDVRWNYIEDYFLGESSDNLIRKYVGGNPNHINIIDYIKRHAVVNAVDNQNSNIGSMSTDMFQPRQGGYYNSDNILNIDGQALKISKWLAEDPVALDKTRIKYDLVFAKNVFDTLINKLRNYHFPYYRDMLGLRILLNDFPGLDKMVQASVVYNDQPVKFYQWWRKHEDRVYLTTKEKLSLFERINQISPQTLLKKHKDQLNKK